MMMLGVVALAIMCMIVVERDRSAARLAEQQCENNLQNVALGLLGHRMGRGFFPDATWHNPALAPEDRISWCGPTGPWLDMSGFWDVVDKDASWDSIGVNQHAATTPRRLLTCPKSVRVAPGSPQPTSYIGIAGLGTDAPLLAKSDPRAGIFGYNRQTEVDDITDGAANTLLVVETADVSGSWLQGGPATVRGLDPGDKPYVGSGRQFGGLHKGGAWVAMADGSVRWVSDSISPKVFEAISTMAGGERLPKDW
jgi:hypothetical protein